MLLRYRVKLPFTACLQGIPPVLKCGMAAFYAIRSAY